MDTNLIDLSAYFNDEDKAHEFIERLRWPNGPVCPHCQSEKVYRLSVNGTSRKLFKCALCRKQFSVMVGTIFEDSHIPLTKWLAGIYLMCSSKKGISAHQLHRALGITYKSAWFMCHRIRYAMSRPPLADKLAGIVEADETYIGPRKAGKRGRGAEGKIPVFALIERGGRARSFKVDDIKARTLQGLIHRNVLDTAHIMTDDLASYWGLDKNFAGHGIINHKEAYVRGIVHTNFAESYFSLLKRGILGTFHHVSERHMQRYCDEFSFRWTLRKIDDGERTAEAVKAIEGKRLMLREPVGA
jgi:transposase-like protein